MTIQMLADSTGAFDFRSIKPLEFSPSDNPLAHQTKEEYNRDLVLIQNAQLGDYWQGKDYFRVSIREDQEGKKQVLIGNYDLFAREVPQDPGKPIPEDYQSKDYWLSTNGSIHIELGSDETVDYSRHINGPFCLIKEHRGQVTHRKETNGDSVGSYQKRTIRVHPEGATSDSTANVVVRLTRAIFSKESNSAAKGILEKYMRRSQA